MTQSTSAAPSNGQSRLLEQSRETAQAAGLSYVSDQAPGITRKRKGRSGFVYYGPDGKLITDEETRHRIRALAIPPAWTEVWICPSPRGHIQAVGRDARRRKQYRYHARWREVRDEDKYGRLLEFARALPGIRAAVRRDLARPGLPRRKVLAAVIAVMEKTFIRVGNDEYARHNDSYGLTTLRDRHARISPRKGKVSFEFRGKSGKKHAIELDDPKLARIVQACQDLPGQELFQYQEEDGSVHDIGSTDVNDYLREISGQDFTAKDFRTWAGTVLAAEALKALPGFESKAQAKKNIVRAVEEVASQLGNTKAVCRKCYIHPEVLSAYLDGSLVESAGSALRKLPGAAGRLKQKEAAVVALLKRRLNATGKTPPAEARRGSPHKPARSATTTRAAA